MMKRKAKKQPGNKSKPDPTFIAQQLRQPSGDFAPEIGLMMNKVNKPLYELTFDVMKLRKNNRILEIGFGNGQFFDALFLKEPDLNVSGIEFSEAMVEAAKENNRNAIGSGKLNIKSGSSEAIPFLDQTFDAVFCNMVVYFWDQPEKHLKEVYRVLKPGGRFYTGMRTKESMLVFPFVKYGFNLYPIRQWEEILVDNGFSLVDTHSRLDSEIETEDNQFRLESCIVVVEKKAK